MRRARAWVPLLAMCVVVLPLVSFAPAGPSAALAAQQRSAPTPPPCTVTVKGPKKVSVGSTIPFYAEVTNSGNASLTYQWSINPSSIGFQDYGDQITTNSVNQPGPVTATVTLGGGPCEGKTDTSDPVDVTGGQAANEAGQCKGGEPIEKCQQVQDRLLAELRKDPNTKALIVYHEQAAQPNNARVPAAPGADTVSSINAPYTQPRVLRTSFDGQQQPTRPESLTPTPAAPAQSQKGPALKLAESIRDFLLRSDISFTRIILDQGTPWPEYGVELFILRPGAGAGAHAVQIPPSPPTNIDMNWGVLPQTVVGDNFGARVRKNFYALNVVISNSSGYDLQVDAIGFAPSSQSAASQPMTPAISHRLVRGVILRERYVGLRGRALGTIKAAGGLLTGATAFFRSDGPRANFGQVVNIISNPLEMGFELLFPDETVEHLDRLENSAFRADTGPGLIVANNESAQTVIFIPKDSLGLPKGERDDLEVVKRKLGTLTIKGQPIQRLGSITIPAQP